jgi:hypothetical protein
MRRIILVMSVAALMVAMVAASALPAFAHDALPHRHALVLPEEANQDRVEVGPPVCTVPQSNAGFQQFHHNVHIDPDHPADVRFAGRCT